MFEASDKDSWYFGPMGRLEANELLIKENENGAFLVRDSGSIKGDFVLCVKEANKISHYIINKIVENAMPRFRIGDQEFSDLPALLTFYKTHYLDSTPLIRPVSMEHRERYQAKYDFAGRDPEDLPFRKGDILVILHKDEEQWWTARNSEGKTGAVPALYLHPEPVHPTNSQHSSTSPQSKPSLIDQHRPSRDIINMQLPVKARVIRSRIPNAYDTHALPLEVGEEILVTATNINGNWEGEVTRNGCIKKGIFPFTYVKLIQDGDDDD